MKKPNIDLSKDGLKRFALHHIEKVILVFALVGFLAFLWLGWSTKPFDQIDPAKLSQKAESAKTHIADSNSWKNVSEMRVARDKANVEVENAEKLEFKAYRFGKIRGTPIRSLSLRNDPDIAIALPVQVEADVFDAPVLFSKSAINRDGPSELDKLPPVGMMSKDADESGRESKDDIPVFGDKLTDLQALTTRGWQPSATGADEEQHTSVLMNIVVVKALVQHEKFSSDIKAKLKNSFGYYPERDRPQYQLVQVQRKEAGGEEWIDITERIAGYQAKFFGLAPEVVAPENYDFLKDSGLCGRIPPIPLIDYRKYALHSALPARQFDKLDADDGDQSTDTDDDGSDPSDFFDNSPDDEEEESDRRGDSKRVPVRVGSDHSEYGKMASGDEPEPEFKIVRFFDLDRKKPNSEYVYRFRVWTADPNNEPSGEVVKSGGRDGEGRQGGRRGIGALGAGAGGEGGGAGLGDGGRDGDLPGAGDGGGRGGRADGGGGNGGGDKEPTHVKTPILDSQKHISVRTRIGLEKKERESSAELKKLVKWAIDELEIDLAYSRATDWVEVPVRIPGASGAEAIAGSIEIRQTRNADGQSLYTGDADAKVVVSEWSGKFGTLVSMLRTVRRGELLSFKSPIPLHVLHAVDGSIRKLAEHAFRSSRVVVDMMGGEEIPHKSPVAYEMPGEFLIMDLESGEFRVQDSMDDKSEYLNRLFQEDESSEFNQERTRPDEPADEGDGRGGRGSLGGLGGGGS